MTLPPPYQSRCCSAAQKKASTFKATVTEGKGVVGVTILLSVFSLRWTDIYACSSQLSQVVLSEIVFCHISGTSKKAFLSFF